MSDDRFARSANELLRFACQWQVDNEKDIMADGEIRGEGRKAIDQIVTEGEDWDRNFIRRRMEEAGVMGFSKTGPWQECDRVAADKFFLHWKDKTSDTQEEQVSNVLM